MFDQPVDDLDARQTLARASKVTRMRNLIDAEELQVAVHWADLHPVVTDATCVQGTERLCSYGGDGTPLVAEFATAELGVSLGVGDHAASRLIGDALDLRHRFPQLWGRVLDGEVKIWSARTIAHTTRHLNLDACAHIDRTIAPYADRKTAGELVAFAEAEAIRADPALARQRAEAARTTQGVWVDPSTETGTKQMFIRAAAADLIRLDGAIDRIADDLALLGDDTSKDLRRAKAVGVLAQPQLALDLRGQAQHVATGQPAPQPKPGTAFPTSTLYIHLTDQTLTTGAGVARVEGIGPVLLTHVGEWLRNDRVTVKPVIDLNNQTPVDAYEIPERLREAVHLAMPTDMFPSAVNNSRRKDLDHTDVYDRDGPPGQTRIGNLAPLTRFHHRIKTHTGWEVKQPFPGILIWRTPHGQHYLVDHTGTRAINPAA
jgi:hypothetical protein